MPAQDYPDRLTVKQALVMLAELEGDEISRPAFGKSMRRAGVMPDDHGRYDKEAVLSARARGKALDRAAHVGGGDGAANKGGRPVGSGGGRQSNLMATKERLEDLKCQKIQAELDKVRGLTMPTAEHVQVLSELGREVQQRMMMIPDSLAIRLAGKSASQMAEMMRAEIVAALSELADKAGINGE